MENDFFPEINSHQSLQLSCIDLSAKVGYARVRVNMEKKIVLFFPTQIQFSIRAARGRAEIDLIAFGTRPDEGQRGAGAGGGS